MTTTKYKKQAKNILLKKWKEGVYISSCYLLFEFIVMLILKLTCNITILNIILGLVNIAISPAILFGLVDSYIKFTNKEEVKTFDFIKVGLNNMPKVWKIIGNIFSKTYMLIILYMIFGVAFIFFGAFVSISMILGDTFAKVMCIVLTILTLIGVIITGVMLFTKLLFYALSFYIACDKNNLTAKESVEESEKIMNGNRMNLFILQLSFIGWILLIAAMSCLVGEIDIMLNNLFIEIVLLTLIIIGTIFLIPYIEISIINFYKELDKKEEILAEKN